MFRFGSEVADTDRAVGIKAEDFVEREHCRRSGRDDRAADDGHLALVNIAAPDGEAAVDDSGDAEHKAEHHNDGKTVADAGPQVGGIEGRALGKSGNGIECEQGGNGEERAKPRADFRSEYFFHGIVFIVFVCRQRFCRRFTRLQLAATKCEKVSQGHKMQ